MTYLHLAGRPVSPVQWTEAMEHKHQGLAPAEALALTLEPQP